MSQRMLMTHHISLSFHRPHMNIKLQATQSQGHFEVKGQICIPSSPLWRTYQSLIYGMVNHQYIYLKGYRTHAHNPPKSNKSIPSLEALMH